MENIRDLIVKNKMFLTIQNKVEGIGINDEKVKKTLTQKDMAYFKEIRNEIITELKIIEKEKEEERKKEEQERIQSYNELKSQLPELSEMKSDNKEELISELKNELEKIHYVSGAEMDGVNLSIRSAKSKIEREIQSHCQHEVDITYSFTYTTDVRKKIIRIQKCNKCGLEIKKEISEQLSIEKILSC